MTKKSFNFLLKTLFPRHCLLCHHSSDSTIDLCTNCSTTLPYITAPCCPSCAVPFFTTQHAHSSPHSLMPRLCGQCQQRPTKAQLAMACFHYQSPIKELLIGLKFNHQLPASQLLGHLMAKQIKAYYQHSIITPPHYIVPMPLHAQRLKERGFNQASLLAKPISQILGIPIHYNVVKRQLNTASQSSLPAKKRWGNVKNAFVLAQPLKTECVAVIDDVITTGSTTRALCKVLLSSGDIKAVHLWSCIRA